MKKTLLLLLLMLSGLQLYSQPRDTTTLLAITYEVYYHGAKQPYVYYWAISWEMPYACPIYITETTSDFYSYILNCTVKDTVNLTFSDYNGLDKPAIGRPDGYTKSLIDVIDKHKILVQKERVRNRYGYHRVGPLKYTTKVYLTPIRGVFGQFITRTDAGYTVPLYYLASDVEYDETYWAEYETDKWPNYLRIPYMVLSGCETAPDFMFKRVYFKGNMD